MMIYEETIKYYDDIDRHMKKPSTPDFFEDTKTRIDKTLAQSDIKALDVDFKDSDQITPGTAFGVKITLLWYAFRVG